MYTILTELVFLRAPSNIHYRSHHNIISERTQLYSAQKNFTEKTQQKTSPGSREVSLNYIVFFLSENIKLLHLYYTTP